MKIKQELKAKIEQPTDGQIKLNDAARKAIEALLAQRAMIDNKLQAYLQGCMDTLELKGNWNFDTASCSFNKMPDAPAETKKEVNG